MDALRIGASGMGRRTGPVIGCVIIVGLMIITVLCFAVDKLAPLHATNAVVHSNGSAKATLLTDQAASAPSSAATIITELTFVSRIVGLARRPAVVIGTVVAVLILATVIFTLLYIFVFSKPCASNPETSTTQGNPDSDKPVIIAPTTGTFWNGVAPGTAMTWWQLILVLVVCISFFANVMFRLVQIFMKIGLSPELVGRWLWTLVYDFIFLQLRILIHGCKLFACIIGSLRIRISVANFIMTCADRTRHFFVNHKVEPIYCAGYFQDFHGELYGIARTLSPAAYLPGPS